MRFDSMQPRPIRLVTSFGLFFAMLAAALVLAVMAAWLAAGR
jgi:hypothetical protein